MKLVMPDFSRVLEIFLKLCKIPHGSGNLEEMVRYLRQFAQSRGAVVTVDGANNVIVEKKSKGTPLAVQAHIDMVCESDGSRRHDFLTDPICPILDGDRLYADGTTLGADDGIGVAMALALLEGDFENPLYLILTADEEIGLLGANALRLGNLPLKTLINLDSEEEGIITIGCADGVLCDVTLENLNRRQITQGAGLFSLSVSGLLGGHSGTDIHRNRGNAIKIICEILEKLPEDIRLCGLDGGSRHSAIPKDAKATFAVSKNYDPREIVRTAEEYYKTKYNGFFAAIEPVNLKKASDNLTAFTAEDTKKILNLIKALPHGVVAKSHDFEGLTETSVNLATAKAEYELQLCAMIRSNVVGGSESVAEEYKKAAVAVGAKITVTQMFPIWAFSKNSPLASKAATVYQTLFNKPPRILPIHAGLECGLLCDKLNGLDCISIGPDLHNVHTANEWLSLSSAKRTWEYLYAILRELS